MNSRKRTHSYLKKARNKMFWNGKLCTKRKKVFQMVLRINEHKWKKRKKKKVSKKAKQSKSREKEKGTVNPENYIYDLWFKKRMRGTFSPSIINRWISNIFRHCEIGFFLPLSQHFNNEHIIVFSFVFFFFCSVICGSAQSAVNFMLF